MVGSVLSGSACPSPRPRASPDALPASDARPARTPIPSAWRRPGAGRPLGSALCCCQRWAGSAPLTTRPGGPGAPPSFLLQPRSPSASWPCSLGAGMSPEARSPPSGCRPRPLRIPPEADRGPPSGWPASCSQHTRRDLFEGPARSRRLAGAPLTRRGCPSPRGGPACSSYGFGAEEPLAPGTGLGGLCPAGTKGARPCLAAGPVCHRPSRRPPHPRDEPSRAPTPA